MPGIAGLITKMPREWAEPQLRRMVEALRHEPFYVTGTWIDESLGVYAGWAAQKHSFSDGMPLSSERGDTVLVFSGEDFPEPETARQLKARGHAFDGHPASYLVHVSEEDPAFPASLNGRFHGLLADQSRGTAALFNDRYGMHRLYYSEANEAFYFAAEAKAILAVRPELRRLDLRGLGEFLACGCVLEDRTLFAGVQALPPGSVWVFRGGSIEARRAYFVPRQWEEQECLEPEAWYQELREVFTRNLPRYFNGHQQIGMSLTGGLDTRMILAWHKASLGSLPCYTFGGTFRDCRDVTVARRVARACGQSHQVITVGKDFLSRFPYYAERAVYLTDGCTDLGDSVAALYSNEKAREIAPVRMTGNYGSEVLRASLAFKPVEPLPGLFRQELLSHIHAAKGTYGRLIRTHPLSFAVFRQAPWYHHGLLTLEETQISLRSPFLDNDLVRTAFRAPECALSNSDFSLRLIADGDPALHRIPTDRGSAGNHGRVATLNRSFLEFTFKSEYAYDYGMPQWVARIDHLLSPFRLERLFLGRHKFAHFRVWYRDDLSKYVQETLLDPRTLSRPYLERNAVETLVRGHLNGTRNFTTQIHNVMTLELLHRLFLDP